MLRRVGGGLRGLTSLTTASSYLVSGDLALSQVSRGSRLIIKLATILSSRAAPMTAQAQGSGVRPAKNAWTDQEVEALKRGVVLYGIGNWAKILADSEVGSVLAKRTNVNIKVATAAPLSTSRGTRRGGGVVRG